MRHRRHPLALAVVLLAGLLVAGLGLRGLAPTSAQAGEAYGEDEIALGQELFLANCSSCHGTDGGGGEITAEGVQSGPSLYGVGAAAVDFQVGTGRMPAQASGPADPAA